MTSTPNLSTTMWADPILSGERLSAIRTVEYSYAASLTVGKVGYHYLHLTVGTIKSLFL
jgi:hypothetical protein